MVKEEVLLFVNSEKYSPSTADEIAENFSETNISLIEEAISSLIKDGTLIKGNDKRLYNAERLGYVRGIFKASTKGFGFAECDEKSFYISDKDTSGALNGDYVLVRPLKRKKKSESLEGEIILVVKRAFQRIVGIYKREGNYGIVIPDNDKLPREFFVDPKKNHGALNGQKVVAYITEYESAYSSLKCEIKEILGFPYDFGVDILSVIKSYGFDTDFPEKVINEVNNSSAVTEDELKGRLDLTDKTVITIDGDDTKDIDDAISVEKTDEGYILGVHIADVSHYVLPCSETDKEAYKRGTSVYPVNMVVPMLPVRLSNDLCSLNEGVIRLTMSVMMTFDKDGKIIKSEFFRSFIKSSAKMTYSDVKRILKEHPDELCIKYSEIVPHLEIMHDLYLKLRLLTKKRGAINFDLPEAKVVFDKNGKTVDIVLRENSFSNEMIEEFMIAANSSVAKYLSQKNAGGIFRIHEPPDGEKLKGALTFVRNLGYRDFDSLSELMEKLKDSPGKSAVSAMLLRSMAKARYDSVNTGHYGLMLEYYCHFTSPIRRYPDLICHRALKAAIDSDEKMQEYLRRFSPEASKESSIHEQAAAMCERDALSIKKAEYMEKHIGEEFTGIISSVTGFGFFVMLENTVEGLVSVESLVDDYYIYDPLLLTLTGERHGRIFQIGDSVKVKLASASKISRKIDFLLLEGGSIYARKNKNSRAKQKRISRVFHRRKAGGRH